jgi:hypothetical protein
VTLRAIHVETREPIRIPLKKPINSIQELAEILTAEFGDHVTLVGKAVALISMLAREFIFVFNEEGSGYVTRTRKLNDTLQANGVPLVMHPILRLKYRTWDTLEVAQSTLSLPDHLAATFGQRQIPAADFAHNWRKVVEEQDALLKTLEAIRKPRELMAFLAERGGDWTEQLAAYDEAKKALCTLREHGAAIQALVDTLYEELAATKAQIVATEHDKCLHFHSVTEWTSEAESRRSGFDARIQELLGIRKETLARIHDLKVQRLHLERGEQAVKLREQVVSIEVNAEAARLRLVSNAILTCTGLVHTDHRPSAWWLPMVDPCGHWFQRIAETTEVYTQPVLSA